MKNLVCSALISFIVLHGNAQNHDHHWILGYHSQGPHPLEGGMEINFQVVPPLPPQPMEFDNTMSFHAANASISDSTGNLLFYTNGIFISNSLHETVENGDSINNWGTTQQYAESGVPIPQGTIILPCPGNDSLYYLFHEPVDFEVGGLNTNIPRLYYSLINAKANNGFGEVVEKDELLIEDTLAFGKLTACKHANGRDWWILVPEEDDYTHVLYKLLLTPEVVFNLGKQDAGPGLTLGRGAVGNAVFTPDGSKYIRQDIRFDPWNAIDIFDFDRCTGELFHLEHFELEDTSFLYGGAAVSPDSRHLYAVTNQVLYQFDLTAPSVEATKTVVGEYDGYIAFWFNSTFGTPQLGPDGKIYVASAVSDTVMHVINAPNQPGLLSHFKQHSFNLPNVNQKSIPNFPHYRLGPLDGSPCDTLGLDNHPLAGFAWYAEELAVAFSDNSHYRPETWAWDFGDSGTSDGRNPLHDYASPGEYYVCLTVSNEYDSDTFCQWVAVDTMDVVDNVQNAVDNMVQVTPNPTNSSIFVSFRKTLSYDVTWLLYDQFGKSIKHILIPGGTQAHHVDLSELTAGLYYWRLVSNSAALSSGKLIVVR